MSADKKYDFVVIGAGSGGMGAGRRAASYGKKVALIENGPVGGTCVNVGCVPKKIMFNTAARFEVLHDAKYFGFDLKGEPTFDWGVMKKARDAYINRLHGIYDNNFKKEGIDLYLGTASFVDKNTVNIKDKDGNDTQIHGDHVLIATGSTPRIPNVPGKEYMIDSDGFFDLESQPKKPLVVGAGYIAVEFAGILNAFGSDTTLMCRHPEFLRTFDVDMRTRVRAEMEKNGVKVWDSTMGVSEIKKEDDGTYTVTPKEGEARSGFDLVIIAAGRPPLIEGLNLDKVGVDVRDDGSIVVDEFQNTTTPGIYSLGDVTGKWPLTPVAIKAGRFLSERLFNGKTDLKMDYELIPSIVFSHNVIGTCGLTEDEARKRHGDDNIKIYKSTFINMWYSAYPSLDMKPRSFYKIICTGPEERVVGIHLYGMASDEVLQGFSVAMKMGATKEDFDSVVALHPTAAEEMVTMR